MNSTVVQNVVTYDTIINFDNPDLKLFPGMTAYVTIPVATTGAETIKIPNAALRYKPDLPPAEIQALYKQYGISDAGNLPPVRAAGATQAGGGLPAIARPATRNDSQVVWKLVDGKNVEPVKINTGITDHTFTELVRELNGTVKIGDQLVTGIAQGHAAAPRIGAPGAPRAR
jgi:HlyD family secretion protein